MTYKVSIVIPIYNEEENVKLLHEQIITVVNENNINYELIYVDDGSTDGSFDVLKTIKNENTKIIKFRRNYGQTAALQAGITNSIGDIVITMDADLQNNPSDIPKILSKYNQGYDLVSGWRKKRHDSSIRTIPSKIANFLIAKISKTGLHDSGCTLKAYNGNIIRKINLFADHHRFIPSIFMEYSNKITEIEVEHQPRMYGKSKYNIFRVFRVIIDIIAISYWKKYRNKPMYFWGMLSLFIFTISLICFAGLLINSFMNFNLFLFFAGLHCLFLCCSIIIFAIGLLFENSLRISLKIDNTQNYSIEAIL